MSTLESLIPTPRKLEIDEVELDASPPAVWNHLRHEDLADAPLVRALFSLRTLPSRLTGHSSPKQTLLCINDLRSTEEHPGFQLLAESPLHSLTVGGIGKVWQLDIPFFHVDGPLAFARLSEPGWIKVAWEIRLEPLGQQTTRLTFELRVDATDDNSWQKFETYWHLIGPGSHFVRRVMLSRWRRRSGARGADDESRVLVGGERLPDAIEQVNGLAARAEDRHARDTLRDVAQGTAGAAIMVLALATPFLRSARTHWGLSLEEALRPRPGDDLVAEPLWSWTHAVELAATPEQVWPWVAQIGADRAGFYSYQWLENLAGCDLRNAEALQPEWVHHRGSFLILHPKAPPLPIVECQPPRTLIAFSASDADAKAQGRPWAAASWAFLLEPLGAERCRLVSRFRSACSSDLRTRLTQGPLLVEPIGFAMDRRMLLGIAERVVAAKASSDIFSSSNGACLPS